MRVTGKEYSCLLLQDGFISDDFGEEKAQACVNACSRQLTPRCKNPTAISNSMTMQKSNGSASVNKPCLAVNFSISFFYLSQLKTAAFEPRR
jgi:hypothetical protein